MKNETAKQFLKRAYKINERISLKSERLELLLPSASQKMDLTNVKTTGNSDAFENSVIKYMSDGERIKNELKRLVEIKQEVIGVINLIDDIDESILLEARYIYGCTFTEIAQQLCVSNNHVYKIYNRALEKVARILGEQNE